MKLIVSFIAVVIVLGGLVYFFKEKAEDGKKEIVIEIISKRDDFKESKTYKTDKENLGQFLKSVDFIVYEDATYGMYIKEVKGMKDDQTNQYWWAISVNKEMSTTGVSDIIIKDGSTYTLELKQGY